MFEDVFENLFGNLWQVRWFLLLGFVFLNFLGYAIMKFRDRKVKKRGVRVGLPAWATCVF
jgi:uncharacterized membrane protein YbhN (UPF0104 family)